MLCQLQCLCNQIRILPDVVPHTTFVYRGLQRQHKIEAPCSCFIFRYVYVFTHSWLVFSAWLYINYWTDFHETGTEDGWRTFAANPLSRNTGVLLTFLNVMTTWPQSAILVLICALKFQPSWPGGISLVILDAQSHWVCSGALYVNWIHFAFKSKTYTLTVFYFENL